MRLIPVLNILSILITPMSGIMLISAFIDFSYNNDNWVSFFSSAIITLFIGMSIFLATRGKSNKNLDLRQAFILTTFSWVSVALFGALPYYLSTLNLSFTDSFFE